MDIRNCEGLGGAMASRTGARIGGAPPLADDRLYTAKEATERTIGSVEREIDRLADAIGSLERTVGDHVNRIQSAILVSPQATGSNQTSAPEPSTCDAALKIRQLRQRMEEITEALAFVTSRVDL